MSAQPAGRARNGMRVGRRVPTPRIGYSELSLVAEAIADIAPDWSVELSQAFAGESNLVIMPDEADDTIGPTFVIYQDAGKFCIDQVQWDESNPIGIYPNLPTATQAVAIRLANLTGTLPMPSYYRH